MSGILRFVLGLSLAGGATALVVYILSLPFKKLVKKSWLYYLWLVVLLRFIVPVPLNLPFITDGFSGITSVISSAAESAQTPSGAIDVADADSTESSGAYTDTSLSANTGVSTAANAPPEPQSGVWDHGVAQIGALLLSSLPYIWLTGASALLLWTITGYTLTAVKLRHGRTLLTPGRVPVFESGQITTPILTGLIRPVIYLPSGFPNPELAVSHEMTHFRRGDIWLKWMAQLVVCVHWLNPLAWGMKRELDRLCELACDSAVMARLDQPARRGYGQMILNTARVISVNSGTLVASLGGDKRLLAERLGELISAKKTTKKTVAAMSALTAVILSAAVLFGALFSGCASNNGAAPMQPSPGASATDPTAPSATVSEAAASPSGTKPSPSSSPLQTPATASTSASPDAPAASSAVPAVKIVTTYGMVFGANSLFYTDPAVIGTWQLVDIVDSIDSFEPGKQQNTSYLGMWQLYFDKDEKSFIVFEYLMPSDGGQMTSADGSYLPVESAYEIKEIDSTAYMFAEERNTGDTKSYIVWKQISDTAPAFNRPASPPPGSVFVTVPGPDIQKAG